MELDSASHKCGEKMAQHGSTLLANWEGNCLWAYAHYNLSHSSTIWCWSYSCISSTPSKMKNETVILSLSPNYFMESHQLLLHSSKWCSRTWHDQLEWTGQCKKDQVLKLGQGKKNSSKLHLCNWLFELWCWRRLLSVPWTARDPTSSS